MARGNRPHHAHKKPPGGSMSPLHSRTVNQHFNQRVHSSAQQAQPMHSSPQHSAANIGNRDNISGRSNNVQNNYMVASREDNSNRSPSYQQTHLGHGRQASKNIQMMFYKQAA